MVLCFFSGAQAIKKSDVLSVLFAFIVKPLEGMLGPLRIFVLDPLIYIGKHLLLPWLIQLRVHLLERYKNASGLKRYYATPILFLISFLKAT